MKHHHTTTPPTRVLRRSFAVLAAGSLVLGLAACGDDSASTTTETVSTETVSTEAVSTESTAPVTELTVSGAWARTSPMMATMGAAYMTITSPVDDRLLGAAIDPSVADHAEVHEVVMVESTDTTMAMGSDTTMAMGMGSDTTMAMGGEMTMREVDHIDLMAGVPLELAPGGYHVMIIDLVAPLEIGSSISITLSFETAGDIVVDVPVLDEAP
ncbi:MAG: hypothetical protein RJB65_1383 [Actinomycetota bacterium]